MYQYKIHSFLSILTVLGLGASGAGAQTKLYWSSSDGTGAYIVRADADGSNRTNIVSGAANVRGPNGLETANGLLYWPDQQLNAIQQAKLDGSGVTTFASANNPYDVFGTAQQIYWTSQTGSYIDTQLTNGTGYQRLFTSATVSSPFAIEVTTSNIYWSQVNGSGSIRRADLNGSNIVTVIPNAFVYDFQVTSNYIYFADNNFPSAIKRANLNGTGITNLVADFGFYNGICVTSNALYWSALNDGNGGGIRRCNLDGSNPTNLYNAPGGTSVRGIVVLSDPVVAAPAAPRFTNSVAGPNGFTYTLIVEAGRTYRVETSGNLTNWTEITNFVSAGTNVTFTNTIPAGTNLFFRARTP